MFTLALLCSASLIFAMRMKTRITDFTQPYKIEGGKYNPDFDAKANADKLYKAMKGFGTDEKTIIDITSKASWYERQLIRQYYDEHYTSLIKSFKKELSFYFKDFIISLYSYPYEYDSNELERAMKWLGTNERALNEILITRGNEELKLAEKYFEYAHEYDLNHWISSETSGDYKELLLELAKAERDTNNNPDENECKEEAKKIQKGKTAKDLFTKVLGSKSFAYIKKWAEAYQTTSGKSLLSFIDSNFKGDLKKCYKDIVNYAISPSAYYASRIRESVKGLGTNERKLNRAFIYRSEIDFPAIAEEYRKIYKDNMLKDIKDDTTGDYEKILVAIYNKYVQ